MKLKVRYSLHARHEEIELLEYIHHRFGVNKAKEVYNKIEKVLEEVSLTPEMYRVSKKKNNLRKCVLSKQTSIYYRINEEHIEVISFRANRKNPDKFKV